MNNNTEKNNQYIEKLMELLDKAKSPFETVAVCSERLKNAGFIQLEMNEKWEIQENHSYFVIPYSSEIIAFNVGRKVKLSENGIKISCAHTDFPCFKIKPLPDMKTGKFEKINVEPYGGMNLKTWFDRPLVISGKIVLKSANTYEPNVINFTDDKAIAVIPSLAPHMDSETNKKFDIDMQRDFIPVIGLEHLEESDELIKYLAKKIDKNSEDILCYDLYLSNGSKPELIGLHNEFISSPRIDNLASVSALTEALINGRLNMDDNDKLGIDMIAMFDNEEIGSRSKQGADSTLLSDIIFKICETIGIQRQSEIKDIIRKGFMCSVDGAHSLHPNHQEKSDVTNETYMGDGVILKTSASQRYVSDSEASAVIIQLCNKNKINYKLQVNRSGMPGGQTLGPIVSSYLPMRAVDMGIPMLAMHSSNELACVNDYIELVKIITSFFSDK